MCGSTMAYSKGRRDYDLNDLFHNVVTVIITSQMVVSNIVLTAAVILNLGTFIIFIHYNDKKSRNCKGVRFSFTTS